MTKLVTKTHKEVMAQAHNLIKDAFVYPKGSERRSDLLWEAIALLKDHKAQQRKPDEAATD